jgi:eukaryotic-like serine/threonine-protein kinase
MGARQVSVGTVIAGRYRLTAPLSRGGMASVWRAEHLALGSPIAIKLIDPDLVEHDEARARFDQEARAAAALRSPHVVQILDHGVDKDLPFIAMELLDGESLAARIYRLGKLPLEHTARIFQDVARAIKKAHDLGIVHRDLKPDNIFLVLNEDQEIAKVLDFGIAKALHPFGDWKGGTRAGVLIGTPQYMSPEQAQGMPIGPATDLWALGVIAFECVCGCLPFPSENPGELVVQICANPLPVPSQVASVPPRFDAWFTRACHREPESRFSSVKELADTLVEVLLGAPPPAESSGPVQIFTGPSGTELLLDNSFLRSGASAKAVLPPAAPAPAPAPAASAPAASAPAAAAEAPLRRVTTDPMPSREMLPEDAWPTLLMPSRQLQAAALAEAARRTAEASLARSRSKKAVAVLIIVVVGVLGLVLYWGLSDEPSGGPPGADTGSTAPTVPPRPTPSTP